MNHPLIKIAALKIIPPQFKPPPKLHNHLLASGKIHF